MESLQLLYSHFLIISAIVLLMMAYYTFRKKLAPISSAFSILLLGCAVYDYGYAHELTATTLPALIFWEKIQTFAYAFIPSLWLLMALRYAQPHKTIELPLKILLIASPLSLLFVRFVPGFEHLLYTRLSAIVQNNATLLHLEFGPFIYIHLLFLVFSIAFSATLYYRCYTKTAGNLKTQSLILMLSSTLPFMAYLLMIIDRSPLGLDLVPLAVSVTAALFCAALFRYHLLTLAPLAREFFFNWSDQGIFVLDSQYNVIDFNQAASKLFPKALNNQQMGLPLRDLLRQHDELTEAVLGGSVYQFQLPYKSIETPFHHYKAQLKPIFDGTQLAGHALMIEDITHQVIHMRHLEQLANTDSMTGLLNRRTFTNLCLEEIQRSTRYNHPLSLVLLDLDHFKDINDNHGHLAGDATLIQVATICSNTMRSTDKIGRYGGEEFVFLLPETTLEEATNLSERLRTRIESSIFTCNNSTLNVTASIGVSELSLLELKTEQDAPNSTEIFNHLVTAADRSLYEAKNRGRNQTVSNHKA